MLLLLLQLLLNGEEITHVAQMETEEVAEMETEEVAEMEREEVTEMVREEVAEMVREEVAEMEITTEKIDMMTTTVLWMAHQCQVLNKCGITSN